MILFFGTRTGTPRHASLQQLSCTFCGQHGTLSGVLIPHYIHLFWIPVYRLRPIRQVECAHCKRVFRGSELSPEMEEALAGI